MTTSTAASIATATPTANNNQYDLSVSIVCNQLRNRGWYNLAGKIDTHFGQLQFEDSMNGSEFREELISYCQANPLTMDAIADNGDGFLKIMVEACEMQRSSWNLS